VRQDPPGLGDDRLQAAREPSFIGTLAGGRARPTFSRLPSAGDQASRQGTPQTRTQKRSTFQGLAEARKNFIDPLERPQTASHIVDR
jgi:hypothetical protein